MKILPAICLLLIPLGFACAQERDGRIFVEKPGIVLVKPQAWSPANSAQVMRFSSYSDRRARGKSNQGYLELRSDDGKTLLQVEAARVVSFSILPEIPSNIETIAERNQLDAARLRFLEAGKIVPGSSSDFQKMVEPLGAAIAKFDAGELLVDGKWVSADQRRKERAVQIEKTLRANIAAAKTKSDFNLESNSHFLALKALAKEDPGIQPRIDAIQADYRAMVASEEQAAIIVRLSEPSIPSREADSLLAKLSSSANPSEKAKLVLRQAEQAQALSGNASQIRSALDAALAGKPAELPAELVSQIQSFSAAASAYRAGNPPQGLPAPLAEAAALSEFSTKWPEASALMQSKDFAGASRELALLEQRCSLIGPNACAAISELKKAATVEVDKFQKLSAEGEALLGNGQKEAALAKFGEALAVMPDKALQEKVDGLKTN